MLSTLKLTNFRKVRDDEMTLTPGVNLLKGSNEASKTTRIEAIAYAMFGTQALRTSLEDAVTWGEPVSSLKVALTLDIDGVEYVFKRGKSGAEVVKDGEVFCTGQREVSAFAASLMGGDVATAHKLMIASQGNIRGALEEGPKALATLIEGLAGFAAFDTLLENAQARLLLGNPSLLEERLKGAETTLAVATQSMPPRPNDAEVTAEVAVMEQKIADLVATYPALDAAKTEADAVFKAVCDKHYARTTAERELVRAKERATTAALQVESLLPAASITVPDTRQDLRTSLVQAEDFAKRQVAFRFFKNLPDGERYEGDFQTKYDAVQEALRSVRKDIGDVEKAIISAKARRINHDVCDKCGQDVTHLASVIQTNAAVDAEVGKLNKQLATLNDQAKLMSEEVIKFDVVARFGRDFMSALTKVGDYVVLDERFYPPKALWNTNYPVPVQAPDVEGIKAELARVDAAIRATDAAKAQLALANKNLATANADVAAAQAALDKCDPVSSDQVLQLERARNDAAVDATAARGFVIEIQGKLREVKGQYDAAVAAWNAAAASVRDAEHTIDQCKKDIATLARNNALVKKLRTIRPLVADQLWNSVLAAVSVMFTQMRGEPSVVSKSKDGFQVNGQSVESLSGSTKDLLGLAIRCALLRTFIPHCDILLLDEIAAACDDQRTAAMMGFIASAGFPQILLATHEEFSGAICDNLIEL